ncbi:hypothetical protein EDD21DRAFT_412148 [Dissophora ornata]|nr:hypothetical protein EDD21DRAFT_412148 [Dissophora ornata]
MTVVEGNEQHSQVFRAQKSVGEVTTFEIVNIDSQIDQKTGQRVVLWSEIQKVFNGARLVQQNGIDVPFLADDANSPLVPLRIVYRVGAVMDVLIERPRRASSVTPSSNLSLPPSPRGSISRASISRASMSRKSISRASFSSTVESLIGGSNSGKLVVVYKELRDIVDSADGVFNEVEGVVTIKITSRTLAGQFYDALDGERNVRKLDVILDWDVTLDDLRKFAAAVTKAKIVDLTVDGMHYKGPGMDALNAVRRFDPILGLKANGHIQTLRIRNFHYFYYRVRSASLTAPAPQLQVLEIDCPIRELSESYRSALRRILDCSPSLKELKMHGGPLLASLDIVAEKIPKIPSFEALTLSSSSSHLSVKVTFSGSNVATMDASCRWLGSLSLEEQTFLELGHLTSMTLTSALEQRDDIAMTDTLRCNPKITLLRIPCITRRFVDVNRLVTSARARMLGLHIATALRKVEILEDESYNDGHGHYDIVTSIVEFEDNSDLPKTSVNVKMDIGILKDSREHFNEIFSQYGSSIQKLETDHTFNDEHAKCLDDATDKSGSRLVSLVVDSTSLTKSGLECVDRIVERSRNLEWFELKLDLNTKDQRENVEYLLSRLGTRLTGLSLRANDSSEGWSPMLRKLCPTRKTLPNLTSFRMSCACDIPSAGSEWITAMATPPPHQAGRLPPLWRSLSKIQLQHIRLQPEDWRTLIEEIDVTGLEELDVSNSNFSLEEFKTLADCIPDGIESVIVVPLKVLNLQDSTVAESEEVEAMQEVVTRMKTKKAPQLQILGLE